MKTVLLHLLIAGFPFWLSSNTTESTYYQRRGMLTFFDDSAQPGTHNTVVVSQKNFDQLNAP